MTQTLEPVCFLPTFLHQRGIGSIGSRVTLFPSPAWDGVLMVVFHSAWKGLMGPLSATLAPLLIIKGSEQGDDLYPDLYVISFRKN